MIVCTATRKDKMLDLPYICTANSAVLCSSHALDTVHLSHGILQGTAHTANVAPTSRSVCEYPSCAGATYLYENYVGPGFHKLKAEARKVPALQKLIDGGGPKTA